MKKLIGIAAAIPLLALGVSAFTLPAASAAQAAPTAVITTTGTIQLTNMYLNLDVRGNSSANGAVVQVWQPTGGAAQVWQIMSDGTIRHNGLCLDASGGGTKNGTKLDLWACTGKSNQQWNTKNWRVTNTPTGKVVNDAGYGGDGTQQELWANTGTSNEVWSVTPVPLGCALAYPNAGSEATGAWTPQTVPNQGAVITGNPNTSPVVSVQFRVISDGYIPVYQITQQVGLNASGVGTIWVSSTETGLLEDDNINGTLVCVATYGS
jgi:hypothetical protein